MNNYIFNFYLFVFLVNIKFQIKILNQFIELYFIKIFQMELQND